MKLLKYQMKGSTRML